MRFHFWWFIDPSRTVHWITKWGGCVSLSTFVTWSPQKPESHDSTLFHHCMNYLYVTNFPDDCLLQIKKSSYNVDSLGIGSLSPISSVACLFCRLGWWFGLHFFSHSGQLSACMHCGGVGLIFMHIETKCKSTVMAWCQRLASEWSKQVSTALSATS